MNQSTYTRYEDNRRGHAPAYEDAADIPLERDLRQRHRSPQRYETHFERDQGYDSSAWGGVAVALGAGALLTWLATRSGRPQDQMGWSAHRSQDVAIDETNELIASNKVEGTAVYDRNGEKIGAVHNFMVGKRSGRVAYAVVSFGGFLGFGGGYHPLPWNALTYDEAKGGYVVAIDKDRLRNAPRHQENEDAFSNPAFGRQVREYWLVL
jgi:sporulation protein YlmC with PRC-barrel domain